LPVFCGNEIVAFAQSWAHFNDIGGMRAGSLSPDEGDSAPAVPGVDPAGRISLRRRHRLRRTGAMGR
jgi:hypothetical protein